MQSEDPAILIPCPLESNITISEMLSKRNMLECPTRDKFVYDMADNFNWDCTDDMSECVSTTSRNDEAWDNLSPKTLNYHTDMIVMPDTQMPM